VRGSACPGSARQKITSGAARDTQPRVQRTGLDGASSVVEGPLCPDLPVPLGSRPLLEAVFGAIHWQSAPSGIILDGYSNGVSGRSGDTGSARITLWIGFLWQQRNENVDHPAPPRLPHRFPVPHFVGLADVPQRLIAIGFSSSMGPCVPIVALRPTMGPSRSTTSPHGVGSRRTTGRITWSLPVGRAMQIRRTSPCSRSSWQSVLVECFSPIMASTSPSHCWTWRARPPSGP
jgi:hypothetical protein